MNLCAGLEHRSGSVCENFRWIFQVIAQKKELILEHFVLACEFYGKHGVAMMRKHLHEYSKGRAGAPVFRTKINAEGEAKKGLELIKEFFSI